jgi:hypothetical protein
MQVKVIGNAEGQLIFEGIKVIKMTDFGISPPTAFMGAMKVGADVTVKFRVNFYKSQASSQIN